MRGRTATLRGMMDTTRPLGDLLREWRQRRRLSQLDLALEAEISTRHLSFMETGRSRPSREMVLHLAERLEIPLRDRNIMLHAAGFAPAFAERSLDAPALRAAREAVERLLTAHEPHPALVVDRHWTLIAANGGLSILLTGVDPELMRSPVNVLRVSLHPRGLAPHIVNLAEWRDHVLTRLRRQGDITADPVLNDLLRELRDYPAPEEADISPASDQEIAEVVVPFRIRTPAGVLNFFSTTTIFGTPVDITLSELAIEAFFPADTITAEALNRGRDVSSPKRGPETGRRHPHRNRHR